MKSLELSVDRPSTPSGIGAGLILGIAGGAVVATALEFGPALGAAAAGALLVSLFLALRPDWGTLLFFLALILIEEFPSGQGETVERATRTPFYSLSLGIPGLYPTDVCLFGFLFLFLLHALAARRTRLIPIDRYSLGLAVLAGMVVLSTMLSFAFGDPLSEGTIRVTSGTVFLVNDRGAKWIAFFQFKMYAYLFLSYLLGLLLLDRPDRLRDIVRVFLLAALVNVIIGAVRLGFNPQIITQGYPLFYHSPSSWMFAVTIFYVILAWSTGEIPSRHLFLLSAMAGILALYVVASFRRTMYAGIALAGSTMIFYLPPRHRIRLCFAAAVLLALVLVTVIVSPLGSPLGASVSKRIESTGIQDQSTAYRLAVYAHFAENWRDVPLFGFGATPLWNQEIYMGIIPTNLENVHSLYFWLLLRTGFVGLSVALGAIAVMAFGMIRFIRTTRDRRHRRVAISVLLGLVIFLFSGLFNPVYAEARYLVFIGLGFALMSRMSEWERTE